jgi:hypothetical protein
MRKIKSVASFVIPIMAAMLIIPLASCGGGSKIFSGASTELDFIKYLPVEDDYTFTFVDPEYRNAGSDSVTMGAAVDASLGIYQFTDNSKVGLYSLPLGEIIVPAIYTGFASIYNFSVNYTMLTKNFSTGSSPLKTFILYSTGTPNGVVAGYTFDGTQVFSLTLPVADISSVSPSQIASFVLENDQYAYAKVRVSDNNNSDYFVDCNIKLDIVNHTIETGVVLPDDSQDFVGMPIELVNAVNLKYIGVGVNQDLYLVHTNTATDYTFEVYDSNYNLKWQRIFSNSQNMISFGNGHILFLQTYQVPADATTFDFFQSGNKYVQVISTLNIVNGDLSTVSFPYFINGQYASLSGNAAAGADKNVQIGELYSLSKINEYKMIDPIRYLVIVNGEGKITHDLSGSIGFPDDGVMYKVSDDVYVIEDTFSSNRMLVNKKLQPLFPSTVSVTGINIEEGVVSIYDSSYGCSYIVGFDGKVINSIRDIGLIALNVTDRYYAVDMISGEYSIVDGSFTKINNGVLASILSNGVNLGCLIVMVKGDTDYYSLDVETGELTNLSQRYFGSANASVFSYDFGILNAYTSSGSVYTNNFYASDGSFILSVRTNGIISASFFKITSIETNNISRCSYYRVSNALTSADVVYTRYLVFDHNPKR